MERKAIKSGAISEVGHAENTQTLEILFPSGALWRYDNFPKEEYEAFMRAESAGHFFAVAIRACYPSHRVHTDGFTHEMKCGDPVCWCAKITASSREEKQNAKPGKTKKTKAVQS